MIQSSWKAYFLFSQKEIKGIIVLGLILFGSIVVSVMLPSKKNNSIASRQKKNNVLFYFDPNKIDSQQAIQLGIPPKQVNTLLHYRNRGGYFRNTDDFAKLYGLAPALLARLKPYMRITPLNRNGQASYKWHYTTNAIPPKNSTEDGLDWQIDMNTANEAEWRQKTHLPTALIQHIIQYRNYLGAFTKKSQLNKVYGMPDSIYQTLWKHLKIQNKGMLLMNANAMQFNDWKELGLFTDQQIWHILKLKKEQGGRLGWRSLVEACDLTEGEVNALRKRVLIVD